MSTIVGYLPQADPAYTNSFQRSTLSPHQDNTSMAAIQKYLIEKQLVWVPPPPCQDVEMEPNDATEVKPCTHQRSNSAQTMYEEASSEDVYYHSWSSPTSSQGKPPLSHPSMANPKALDRSISTSSLATLWSKDVDNLDMSTISLGSQDSDATMTDELENVKEDQQTRRRRLLEEAMTAGATHAFSRCYQGQFADEILVQSDMDEYGKDHLANALEKEKDPNTKPNPNYLQHQPHIDWKCRNILVLWLVEVHQEFHLRPETLYLTVQILDRYLTRRVIVREQLQLLGLTALWISAKHEEVHGRVPTLDQLVWICCEAFTSQQFKKMELDVCGVLNFQFNIPTPETFLKLQVAFIAREKGQEFESTIVNLSRYLMELALVHKRFMVVPPSILSISSFVLSEALLGRPTWSCKSALVHETALKLYRVALTASSTATAIHNKYSDEIFGKSAEFINRFASSGYDFQVNGNDATSELKIVRL